MMTDYTVRIGTRRGKTAARDLYGIPSRSAADDGQVQAWITDARAAWPWNEGPCTCGGIMRWAEAGYVPWHRICERCGSHWDLHPVTIYLRRYTPSGPMITAYRLPDGSTVQTMDEVYGRGYEEDDTRAVITTPPDPPEVLSLADGSQWLAEMEDADRPGLQAVRALLLPAHILPEHCQHGAIYGGWAQRARFYDA